MPHVNRNKAYSRGNSNNKSRGSNRRSEERKLQNKFEKELRNDGYDSDQASEIAAIEAGYSTHANGK